MGMAVSTWSMDLAPRGAIAPSVAACLSIDVPEQRTPFTVSGGSYYNEAFVPKTTSACNRCTAVLHNDDNVDIEISAWDLHVYLASCVLQSFDVVQQRGKTHKDVYMAQCNFTAPASRQDTTPVQLSWSIGPPKAISARTDCTDLD